MNRTLCTLALAGIAGSAYAQTTGGVSFVAPTQVQAGETFTVDVIGTGTFSPGRPGNIAMFNLAITAANNAGIANITGNPDLFIFSDYSGQPGMGDFEVSGGANVFAFQTLSSGSVLFSFDVTAGARGQTIFLDAAPGTIDPTAPLYWIRSGGFFYLPSANDVVIFTPATVEVIPTPAAAPALALAGLFVARRRR